MPGTVWDHIYKDYLAGGQAWATLKEDIHPHLAVFVEKASFPIKNALDIGCGEGKYLQYLQMKGFRTTGIDSSESAIEMTRQRLHSRGELILADMYEYRLAAATYDFIVSHATLHHGRKKKVIALLDRIYEGLITQGKFFISLPNEDCRKNWAMMAEKEILDDGTCIPLTGPEKGLPHSFYAREEVNRLFARYSNVEITLDEHGQWIVTGEK